VPTVTYVKTYALLSGWASRPADVGLTCPEDRCGQSISSGEVCYRATERDEAWRCWRHFHPDSGPVRV